MPLNKQFSISWQQFSTHYKLIKCHNQHSSVSLYGQYSFYLHLASKQRVFVKQFKFDNEQQLQYMLNQAQDSVKFNQYSNELVKLINYCIRIDGSISWSPSNQSINTKQKSFIQNNQKTGSLLLLYQNYRSLQEIINHMLILPSSNKDSVTKSPGQKSKSGLSPSKYISLTHSIQQHPSFSQRTLQKILFNGFNFIRVLKQNKIQTIKSIVPEMIEINHIKQIDQQCKYFLYLFSQNQIIDLLKDNFIDVENSFVSQQILNELNDLEQSNRTMRVYQNIERGLEIHHSKSYLDNSINKQLQNSINNIKPPKSNVFDNHIPHTNEYLNKQLPSPTFSFKQKDNYQNAAIMFTSSKPVRPQYELYIQLTQSLGLLLSKLMLLAFDRFKYLQTKFYLMNQHYKIELNYNKIENVLQQLKMQNKYSKKFIEKVQYLVFKTRHVKEFQQIQIFLNSKNINLLNKSKSKSKGKGKIQNLKGYYQPKSNLKPFDVGKQISRSRNYIERNPTPNRKAQLDKNSSKSRSKKAFNQTLNQRLPFFYQKQKQKIYSKPKSVSQIIQKSSSIQKISVRSRPNSIIQNHLSSTKKPISPQNSTQKLISPMQSSIKNQFSNRQKFRIIQEMKRKILYDQSGNILPNIIQKTFRDGSTYIGQYNPKTNTKQGRGVYFYFQGDIYGGTWQNDQLNGFGIYQFTNGDTYQGNVKEGQKDGEGVYKYANGNLYTGQWKIDKKQGQGTYLYANGDSYQGQFASGLKQEFGFYKWANGDAYQGYFTKNLKHGKGIFKQANSSNILQGIWQKDKLSHQQSVRIKYQKSKNMYTGQVTSNGNLNGNGKFFFNDNSMYQGQFKSNSCQGQCQIKYSNGDIFKGHIKGNQFHGYGEYFFSHKNFTYKGNWRQGLQHGQGKIFFHSNGTIIQALWQAGKYSIYRGTIFYKNEQKYEGDINEEGRHGRGKYYFSENKWIQGQFQNNKLVHIYAVSSLI